MPAPSRSISTMPTSKASNRGASLKTLLTLPTLDSNNALSHRTGRMFQKQELLREIEQSMDDTDMLVVHDLKRQLPEGQGFWARTAFFLTTPFYGTRSVLRGLVYMIRAGRLLEVVRIPLSLDVHPLPCYAKSSKKKGACLADATIWDEYEATWNATMEGPPRLELELGNTDLTATGESDASWWSDPWYPETTPNSLEQKSLCPKQPKQHSRWSLQGIRHTRLQRQEEEQHYRQPQ